MIVSVCGTAVNIFFRAFRVVAYSVPSHYFNQCWVIVNFTLRNKLQRNFNQNTNIFIHENAFEIIVCEMMAILSRRDELTNIRIGLDNLLATYVS